VVQEHGGKFSVGKHYKSKKYGIYTEIIFALKKVERELIIQRKRRALVGADGLSDSYPKIGTSQWEARLTSSEKTNVEQSRLRSLFLEQPWIRPEPLPVGFDVVYEKVKRRILVFDHFQNVFPIKAIVGKPRSSDIAECYDSTLPWWRILGPSITSLIKD